MNYMYRAVNKDIKLPLISQEYKAEGTGSSQLFMLQQGAALGIATAIICTGHSCRPFLALTQLQMSPRLRIIKAAPNLHTALQTFCQSLSLL